MPDRSNLSVPQYTSNTKQRLDMDKLGLEAIIFAVEKLGATGAAYLVWDNEAYAPEGLAFDLASPSVAMKLLVMYCLTKYIEVLTQSPGRHG